MTPNSEQADRSTGQAGRISNVQGGSKPKDTKSITTVMVNGVEYWQPECRCTGPGHICYIRPTPQKINVPIETILKNLAGGSI